MLRASAAQRAALAAFLASSSRCLATAAASNDALPVVGFIGLGVMGLPMSSNLARSAQYSRLVLHDVSKDALDAWKMANKELVAAGRVEFAKDPASVAAKAIAVFTMLPTGAHVRSVYLDKSAGLLSGAQKGSLFVDTSTIEPEVIHDISAASAAAAAAARVIDAPVSGGVIGARAATLTFMLGGPAGSLADARPWLSAMGKNIVHCGEKVGTGQVAKICNNMLLGTTMVATCEALHLAARNGMDPKLMTQIINISSGRSWCSDTYNPVPGVLPNAPATSNYEGGFNIRLMQKDMALALANSQRAMASVPLAAAASQVYKHVMTAPGLSTKDFSIIYSWLEHQTSKYVKKKN